MSQELEPISIHITGPAPIQDIHLSLRAGVHAIYGMNGAGKSRLVHAVASMLLGEHQFGGSVLCTTDQLQIGRDLSTQLELVLWDLACDLGLVDYPMDTTADGHDVDRIVPFADVFSAVLRHDGSGSGRVHDDRWAAAIAEQRLWLLEPVAPFAGAWAITPAWNPDQFGLDERAAFATLLREIEEASIDNGIHIRSLRELVEHPLLRRSPLALAVAEAGSEEILSEVRRLGSSVLNRLFGLQRGFGVMASSRSQLGRPA